MSIGMETNGETTPKKASIIKEKKDPVILAKSMDVKSNLRKADADVVKQLSSRAKANKVVLDEIDKHNELVCKINEIIPKIVQALVVKQPVHHVWVSVLKKGQEELAWNITNHCDRFKLLRDSTLVTVEGYLVLPPKNFLPDRDMMLVVKLRKIKDLSERIVLYADKILDSARLISLLDDLEFFYLKVKPEEPAAVPIPPWQRDLREATFVQLKTKPQ